MNGNRNEHLDRLANAVTRAGGISDDDVDRISLSPFLHTRVRARIDAEERNRVGQGSGWLAMLMVASRAIAVLVLVTMAAASTFWISRSKPAVDSLNNAKSSGITPIAAGGTCALSSTDQCAISTEAVLATMFAGENRKEEK